MLLEGLKSGGFVLLVLKLRLIVTRDTGPLCSRLARGSSEKTSATVIFYNRAPPTEAHVLMTKGIRSCLQLHKRIMKST